MTKQNLIDAILAGDRAAVEAAMADLPWAKGRVQSGPSGKSYWGRGSWVSEDARRLGLDPSQPLPQGAKLVTYAGPATGHGRSRVGEQAIEDSLDVSGKVPIDLESMWTDLDYELLLFGAGKGLRYPAPNGGTVTLEL